MTDEDVAEIMREYAEQAVAQAQKQHNTVLDYTEQSLVRLDIILSRMTGDGVLPTPAPGSEADEGLWLTSKAYGGYLGEVMRKHLGGVWRHKLVDGADTVELEIGTVKCSPPERIWKRLTSDSFASAIGYYRGLQHLLGKPLFQPDLPKRSLWKRLFR
jgi:hypothetical protein